MKRVHTNETLVRCTASDPCPKCGGAKWCSRSADGGMVICMRDGDGAVKQSRDGGYVHVVRGRNAGPRGPRVIRVRIIPPKVPNGHFARLSQRCQDALSDARCAKLARRLGLRVVALRRLCVGWNPDRKAYSFPMQDERGRVVGIRYRTADGRKFAERGGTEGLFVPNELGRPDRLFITEGPTDCAVLLGSGLAAIGRPSCTSGAALCVRFAKRLRPAEVVLVGDNDSAGRRGISELAVEFMLNLAIPCREARPPAKYKDVREWVRIGATAADVRDRLSKAERHQWVVRPARQADRGNA